jgi:hypothetical protein
MSALFFIYRVPKPYDKSTNFGSIDEDLIGVILQCHVVYLALVMLHP